MDTVIDTDWKIIPREIFGEFVSYFHRPNFKHHCFYAYISEYEEYDEQYEDGLWCHKVSYYDIWELKYYEELEITLKFGGYEIEINNIIGTKKCNYDGDVDEIYDKIDQMVNHLGFDYELSRELHRAIIKALYHN
jgi:hypothetical protein